MSQNSQGDLKDFDRQLQCLTIRLDRFCANPDKDCKKSLQIAPYIKKLKEIRDRSEELHKEGMEMLKSYRQLVDEFRISLFAPELKTRKKVSAKKLDQFWQETLAKL